MGNRTSLTKCCVGAGHSRPTARELTAFLHQIQKSLTNLASATVRPRGNLQGAGGCVHLPSFTDLNESEWRHDLTWKHQRWTVYP